MILVTGSAGYIGSHVSHLLVEESIGAVGLDNLHTGLLSNSSIMFYVGDLRNKNDIKQVFEDNEIDYVMHLAALTSVPESMEKPDEYFDVNTEGTKNLLQVMQEFDCRNIIFSSTASVYQQSQNPVKESDPLQPLNNYAISKLKAEEAIKELASISELNYVIFRYFNVIGYDKWYDMSNEGAKTNVVPALVRCMNSGDTFNIFGNCYPVKRENPEDHTCVRDYIDVRDIARAHLLAYNYMKDRVSTRLVCNLGTKNGTSVLELLNAFEIANQVKLNYSIKDKRKGDPASIIADSTKANELLNWTPQYSLEDSLTIF